MPNYYKIIKNRIISSDNQDEAIKKFTPGLIKQKPNKKLDNSLHKALLGQDPLDKKIAKSIINTLIERRSDYPNFYPHTLYVKNYYGHTPLFLAAYYGNYDIVTTILEDNTQFRNKKDKLGWSPLFAALYRGHSDVAQVLLEEGAQLTTSKNKRFVRRTLKNENRWQEYISLKKNVIQNCRWAKENLHGPSPNKLFEQRLQEGYCPITQDSFFNLNRHTQCRLACIRNDDCFFVYRKSSLYEYLGAQQGEAPLPLGNRSLQFDRTQIVTISPHELEKFYHSETRDNKKRPTSELPQDDVVKPCKRTKKLKL